MRLASKNHIKKSLVFLFCFDINNKVKYRNEWKYECNIKDICIVQEKIKKVMKLDKHIDLNRGYYLIQSLYFDDFKNSCMHDNEAGLDKRFKYRIRFYNNDNDKMLLEKKIKYQGRCYKKSEILSAEEYEMVINNKHYDLFNRSSSKLIKEFCIDCITKGYKPKVIVCYKRIAYVDEIQNIRITIDTNISCSKNIKRFIDGDYLRVPVQDNNSCVLEIKFDDFLPSHIKNCIQFNKLNQTTFSKYYLSRLKTEAI